MHLGAASGAQYRGGRATDRMRGLHRLSSPGKLRMPRHGPGSEGAGAKVRVRERDNSDHRLRPQIRAKLKTITRWDRKDS